MTTSSQVYTTATSVSSSLVYRLNTTTLATSTATSVSSSLVYRLNTTTLATSTATSVSDVCMTTTTTTVTTTTVTTTTTVASTIQLSSQRGRCTYCSNYMYIDNGMMAQLVATFCSKIMQRCDFSLDSQ